MSWVQKQHRGRQGAWVATMPAMVGYSATSAARSCPLVGLVGACCSGCAEGKGCAAKEELTHSHVGSETAIPWEDVQASNATIEHVQEAAGALADSPQGSPEMQRYALWSLFYSTWKIWYASAEAQVNDQTIVNTFNFGVKILIGPMADTYKSLILSFNEQLKALDGLKVQSTAAPIDTRSPAGKAFDKTIEGVLGGAGGALGSAATILTYVAVAGGVLLLGYVAWPFIAAKVLK